MSLGHDFTFELFTAVATCYLWEMQSKGTLRLHFQSIRDNLSTSDRGAANLAIFQHLVQLPIYTQARALLAYCAFRTEVETQGIIAHALSCGKQVYAPRLTDQKGIMEVAQITSIEDVAPGAFGIPEPKSSIPAQYTFPFDLILIPGLAFDRAGFRLGYGGGYYDRFLQSPEVSGYRMGLGFSVQFVDQLPSESFDQPLDGVLTEKGFFPTQHA